LSLDDNDDKGNSSSLSLQNNTSNTVATTAGEKAGQNYTNPLNHPDSTGVANSNAVNNTETSLPAISSQSSSRNATPSTLTAAHAPAAAAAG
jgi:hypothetical protein